MEISVSPIQKIKIKESGCPNFGLQVQNQEIKAAVFTPGGEAFLATYYARPKSGPD